MFPFKRKGNHKIRAWFSEIMSNKTIYRKGNWSQEWIKWKPLMVRSPSKREPRTLNHGLGFLGMDGAKSSLCWYGASQPTTASCSPSIKPENGLRGGLSEAELLQSGKFSPARCHQKSKYHSKGRVWDCFYFLTKRLFFFWDSIFPVYFNDVRFIFVCVKGLSQ